jgi:hypothetical protein
MSAQMRIVEDFSNQTKKGNRGSSSAIKPEMKVVPIVNEKSAKLSDKWVLWSHHINDNNWDITSYSKICELVREDDFLWLVKNFPALDDHILYLMRKDIVPIWEDPRNRNGGCFSYKISKKYYREIWTDTCKALIFDYLINQIEYADTITGISINPRTNTLKIWNNNRQHNEQSYVNPCVKGVDFKGCMYKPHQIDDSRRVETGFRGSGETVDSQKSDEQKVAIMLQRIVALMSKLVKTNLGEFTIKLQKMEELFGEEYILKAFEKYKFINPQNENEYMYIKLKLQLIYGLKCKRAIYKMIFDRMITEYNKIITEFAPDEDLTPKNISELEEENASEEEIERNIYITERRNEIKCISVALYYYIRISLLGETPDFWTDLINKSLSREKLVNPYLVFDGIMRLIIVIKSKLTPKIIDNLKEYKEEIGNSCPRKIRFAIDDICVFLLEGKKTHGYTELYEVYTE